MSNGTKPRTQGVDLEVRDEGGGERDQEAKVKGVIAHKYHHYVSI